jgi:cytochrome c oxidase subunit 1/cytochrome c oxidase subunit I+III
VVPLDWQIHDTYWVVSHIHYVLVGANLFPVIAAFYYWTPKMTGRLMSERVGKWSFWISFIGFNLAFFTMQLLGVAGMPRRIYTYVSGTGWDTMNLLVTVGAFILAFGLGMTLYNFFWSLKYGVVAGKNPWKADSLEWDTESPPEPYGSVHIPTVTTRHPLWDEHEEELDPSGERILDEGRLTFVTSWLDGFPQAVATMPEDTVLPLILALGMFVMFLAFVFQWMWVVGVTVAFSLLITAIWLWPKEEPKVI